jgi:hypothetical protein
VSLVTRPNPPVDRRRDMEVTLRRLILTLAVALMVVTGFGYGSQPVHASTFTWVYVVINNRVCNVHGTNLQVRSINANVTQTGWTVVNDSGDNIVYSKVRINRTNQFTATAACYKKVWLGWQPVGYAYVWADIYPTRFQQTLWVG